VCTDGTGALVCPVALSGQAPKPHGGAPQARGLTANAPTEQSRAVINLLLVRFLPRSFGPQFFRKGLTKCNVIVHHVGRNLAVLKEG
jgi:hypothetical protein